MKSFETLGANVEADKEKMLAAKAARCLKTAAAEVARFRKFPLKKLISFIDENPSEALCSIPDDGGHGSIFCGSRAIEALANLARIPLELEPRLDASVSPEQSYKLCTSLFVKYFLNEGRIVTVHSAVELLAETTNQLRASLQDSEHFLPCVFFLNGGPDEFSIGPVRFTRARKFFRDNRARISRSVQADIEASVAQSVAIVAHEETHVQKHRADEARRWVRILRARAIKTYRIYPWVAQVTVSACDKNTSKERAREMVELALNVVRVLLGASNSKRIRLAWANGKPVKTAEMWSTDGETIGVRISSGSISPVGGENWHDLLIREGGSTFELLSELTSARNATSFAQLGKRVIDSIHWFGDGAVDEEPTAQVIKYTSGIERLIFGKFVAREHKKRFATRIATVVHYFYGTEVKEVYDNAMQVYGARSRLLHGTLSPRDREAKRLALLAEELCQLCIICMARLFAQILHVWGDPSPDKFDDILQRMTEDEVGFFKELFPGNP